MVILDNIKTELLSLKDTLNQVKLSCDIERKEERVAELEREMQEPTFWNDVDRANKLSTECKTFKQSIDDVKTLENQFNDILEFIEIAGDEEGMEEEIVSEFEKFKSKLEDMRISMLLSGEHDSCNAILRLNAGAGGTESCDWVSILYRMYTRWAESHGFAVEELDYVEGDTAGIQSVSFMIKGENAYGFLRSELGVHRLVRISPFDAAGRRHTSFASCEVIPELDQKTEDDIKIDMSDVRVDTYRATGKGGQHINKTDTAVRMTHNPTGIVVSCQAERSQLQNKETCLRMLKAKLFALARASEMEKIEDLKGNQMEIAWGSQIRSYVFCPYTLVKDNRTGYEEVDVDAVMDGMLDGFINAYLSGMKNEK